ISIQSDIFYFLPTSVLYYNLQFKVLITSKTLKYFFTIFDMDIGLFNDFKTLYFSILINVFPKNNYTQRVILLIFLKTLWLGKKYFNRLLWFLFLLLSLRLMMVVVV